MHYPTPFTWLYHSVFFAAMLIFCSCGASKQIYTYNAASDEQIILALKSVQNSNNISNRYVLFDASPRQSSLYFGKDKLPHYMSVNTVENNGAYYISALRYDYHTMARNYMFKDIDEEFVEFELFKYPIHVIYDSELKNNYLCMEISHGVFNVYVFYLGQFKEKKLIKV